MGLFHSILNIRNEDKLNLLRNFFINLQNLTLDEHGQMYNKAFIYALEMRAEGDYLEFGCFSGKTMSLAYRFSRKLKFNQMNFYAFDSFQGLPEIYGVDSEVPEFKEGEYCSTEKQFFKDLKINGVDVSRVTTIPGWYDDTLTPDLYKRLPIKKAAIVMIDCDLYSSAKPVLEFITPYLVDGTVLLFDDWYCFNASPARGHQKACKEWLDKNKDISLVPFLPFECFGLSFIVNRS